MGLDVLGPAVLSVLKNGSLGVVRLLPLRPRIRPKRSRFRAKRSRIRPKRFVVSILPQAMVERSERNKTAGGLFSLLQFLFSTDIFPTILHTLVFKIMFEQKRRHF